MIELFIDGREVDLAEGSSVELSLSLEEITAPGKTKETTFPLTLPMSARNRAVLGFPEQALSPKAFNRETHTGKITSRGSILLHGRVELTACEANADGTGRYRITLRVPPPAWIERAGRRTLAQTAVACPGVLDQETIRRSWSDGEPVKFLPVKWDRELPYGQTQAVLDSLGYDNYYPFVRIKTLLEAVAGDAGYRIESQFLNEPFFQSLYMSGKYSGSKVSGMVSRMDFTARKTTADKSTTVAADGRVYTTVDATNSVGAVADAVDPPSGSTAETYGQSFRLVDGRPAFVPERDVVAGFEFLMKIGFQVKFIPPDRMAGISTMSWGEELLWETKYPNPMTDKKNSGGPAGTYRFCSFSTASGNRRITHYTAEGGKYSSLVSNNQPVSIPRAFVRATCEDYVDGKYVLSDDWSLYEDAEYRLHSTSARQVEIAVRSRPLPRRGGEPVFFDTIVFEGGAPNSLLTLYSGATIRPLFFSMPEPGGSTAFATLFAHEKTQLELIDAVAHLFGLHFYTDDAAKTIRIEPRFTFLDEVHTIDWTEKIDHGQPLLWQELGSERYETETLTYRPGDAAVERNDAGTGTVFGRWSVKNTHRFARHGEKTIENPLFTATRDERNSLASASAASMIVVGDREQRQGVPDFPGKIVRYLGLQPLPRGQTWGWPAKEQEYPAVGFSPALDGFTLCFDDENGQLGLRHYHQPLYDLAEKGRILTLYLYLSPSDIEAVRYPNSACRDFRGNFAFRIRGERFRARLVEISGYDPDKRSTRCTFTVEP